MTHLTQKAERQENLQDYPQLSGFHVKFDGILGNNNTK